MIVSKEQFAEIRPDLDKIREDARKKIEEAEPDHRLRLEIEDAELLEAEVFTHPEEIPVFDKDEKFRDVDFTPSEDNPLKCVHCGEAFSEHVVDSDEECFETMKKLFTKSHYKRLEEAKYDAPRTAAAKEIESADEDTVLYLEIKWSNGLQVIDAKALESQQDFIEALTR